MGELIDTTATRWDLDRIFRRDGLGTPFSDGVSFADVDFEIERNDRFLVLEGKRGWIVNGRRELQPLKVGQKRAMEARLRTGRTCAAFWGDPDTGIVIELGIWVPYFAGSHAFKLVRQPADNTMLFAFCASWWRWADEQPAATRVPNGFDAEATLGALAEVAA